MKDSSTRARLLTAGFVASIFAGLTFSAAVEARAVQVPLKIQRSIQVSARILEVPQALGAEQVIDVVDGIQKASVPQWRIEKRKAAMRAIPEPVSYETSYETSTDFGGSAPAPASVGPFAIPTYIVLCESGGSYTAENPVSTASGAYQILDSSWAGYGGYSHAADAPPAVQDAKAALMWANGAGASHWQACL